MALLGCDPYREGERLLLAGDPRAAAAAIHPRDARGHELRAAALLAAHEVEEARLEARFAVATKPRDAQAWALLGRVERAAGRPAAALAALERAAAQAPDHRELDGPRGALLAERGAVLQALGRGSAADRDFGLALRLDPSLGPKVAELRRRPAPAPAGAALAAGPLIDGDAPPADRITRLLAAGARQSALETLADWVAGVPALAVRGPQAAALLAQIGEGAAALELLDRMAAEDPSDVPTRLELARAALRLGQRGRAEQEIDEAIWAAHDRAAALRQAATVLESAGRRRQACALLSRALAFRMDAGGLRTLGECLERDGQVDQARAVLDRACSLDPACHAAAR